MSRTLFIADIHLCQEEPAITAGFLRFLQREAPRCDALYILGDLFEAWIGDDDLTPLHQHIARSLHALPCPIFFIRGNRDFLLGHAYARFGGMRILPEQQTLTLHGQRLLIMHGDTLCTDDTGYQRFRRRVHQRWLQKLFLALPLSLRKRIAARMRAGSQQSGQQKDPTIMDVSQQAVEQTMSSQQVQLLIHGHTHRPAIHDLSVDGQPARRVVLGAWHQRGSVVQLDEQGVQLIEFDF